MATAELDQNYMAKSKTKRKADYINELVDLTRDTAEKLTVKQLRVLVARHAQS